MLHRGSCNSIHVNRAVWQQQKLKDATARSRLTRVCVKPNTYFVRSLGQPLMFSVHYADGLHLCNAANAPICRQGFQEHTRPGAQDVHAEPRNGLGEVQGHQEGVHEGAFDLVRHVSSLRIEQICPRVVVNPDPLLQ